MGLYRSKNITAAKRTADKWFNRYIRLRDADKEGIVECITCETPNHIKSGKVDAAHFVEADRMATRYVEENVNGSCKSCNLSSNGKQYQHGKAIDLKYGPGMADELIEMAEENVRFSKQELMEMAREYKEWAEKLAEIKGIEI